jgi:outer membrane protein assembly factor BamB
MFAAFLRGVVASALALSLVQPGATLWTARASGPGQRADFALDVAIAPDGLTAFVTGWSMNATSDRDYLTVAYDVGTGAVRWTSRYADGFQAAALAVAPDGSAVFVTGEHATLAYDAATGSLLWAHSYGLGSSGSWDEGMDVAATSSAVIVAVRVPFGTSTVAHDPATGDVMWERPADGARAWEIAVSPDETSAVVTGYADGATIDYVTLAYDTDDGALRWIRTFAGSAGLPDAARSVAVSNDLAVVTGESAGATSVDRVTVAYDLVSGTTRWQRRYDGPAGGDETVPSVAFAPDGSRVYATGRSAGEGTGGLFDYATTAYDATTGATVWTRRANADVGSYAYFAPSIAASPDGASVIITGRAFIDDYLTVAYAPNGDRMWGRRLSRGTNASSAIAIAPDGATAIVTGTTWGAVGSNYLTVAYAVRATPAVLRA